MKAYVVLFTIVFSCYLSLSAQNNSTNTENIPIRICVADNHFQHTIDSSFLVIKIDSINYSVTHFYPSGKVEFQMMAKLHFRSDTTWVLDEEIYKENAVINQYFVLNANGPFDSWHENNQKYMSGNFSDCAKNGLWEYYDEAGVIVCTELWENGAIKYKLFKNQYVDLNNRINSNVFSITQDLLEATFMMQNESNDTLQNFDKSMYVYELGTDTLIIQYSGDRIRKKYTTHLFIKRGSDFMHIFDGNAREEKIIAIGYELFYADGTYISYWPNDSIYESGDFSLGYRNGEWLKYDETGKIISKTTWKNGKIIDLQTY